MSSGRRRLGPKVRDFNQSKSIKNKAIEPVRTFNPTAETAAISAEEESLLHGNGIDLVEFRPADIGSVEFGLKGLRAIRRSKYYPEGSAQLRRGRRAMACPGPLAALDGETAKDSPASHLFSGGLNRLHRRKGYLGRRESGIPAPHHDPAQLVNLQKSCKFSFK